MNFFLDNNLPPSWAACLEACSRSQFDLTEVGSVVHLKDRFPQNTPDIAWIQELAAEANWTVISCDAFRKKNGAERKIIQKSKIAVFVLQSSWSSHPYWDKTSQIIRWWPRIVAQTNAVDSIAVEVPWRFSARFKQL